MANLDAPSLAQATKRERALVTPEGTPLTLRIADASERGAAFIIDALIIIAAIVALIFLGLGALGAGGAQAGEFIAALLLFGFFALRNFYFMAFEMGPGAATPGKRLFKLRVAARDGGRLTTDAVFARNAMRELEVFLPLSFLAAQASDIDAWTVFAGIVWSGVFVFFPLFNRDRLRAGDLIAGTWVIKNPRPVLLQDLTEQSTESKGFAFTAEQLDFYGEHELGVLENVLRRVDPPTIAAVAERIRAKIGWTKMEDQSDFAFLNAYYKALRGRLEAGLLFGKRRRSKHDRAG